MKVISDIRIFKSNVTNVDGCSLPSYIENQKAIIIAGRIAMKLRENHFSLGDYDHLYLNYTNCLLEGQIKLSKRSIDKYHPWYRYYDIGVSDDLYNNLDDDKSTEYIVNLIRKTFIKYFSLNNSGRIINESIDIVLNEGENMMMFFKEKRSSKNIAKIFLKLLDNGKFLPILQVFDLNNNIVLDKELGETFDLSLIRQIKLNTKNVTVCPRTNAYTKDLKSITFSLKN